MIACRSQYGSANPTAIIAPAIAAALVSTLVDVVYCMVKDHAGRSGNAMDYVGEDGMPRGGGGNGGKRYVRSPRYYVINQNMSGESKSTGKGGKAV